MRIPKNMDPGRLKAALDRLEKRGVIKKVDPALRKAIEKAIEKQ
jgi:DNA-binding MarR family transcriptional regulator